MALQVSVEPVLDVTSPEIREEIGVRKRLLTGDSGESLEACRRIADWARLEGNQAVLAPSAADPEGTVLAIYPDVGPVRKLELAEVTERRTPLEPD